MMLSWSFCLLAFMDYLLLLNVGYYLLFFSGYLVLLLLLVWHRPRPVRLAQSPRVSILVAIRNEEANIIRCLQALARLNYPPEKLEVLLGDDASTDQTAALIHAYIQDKPQFRYHYIGERLGQARGKANVLAHLVRVATTDIFFMTDADTAVPPGWIPRMLAGLYQKPNTGIVTGTTTIGGRKLFFQLQALDWLNALGLMQVLSDLDIPVSTLGNNMLVTRQAYQATGGYESLPFSVTEDVQLLKAVLRKGFSCRNIFEPDVLAVSEPAPTWLAWWQQRKRWMVGVQYLPWYMVLIVGAYGAFYLFCLVTAVFVSWKALLGIFFGKVLFQTAFIHRCLHRLNLRKPLGVLLLFEFYLIFASLINISFFLLPGKIIWKGRKY